MSGRIQMKLETEFLSPVALDRCIKRLKSLKVKGLFSSTRVYINKIDEYHATYEISQWYGLNFVAKVSGDLFFRDENTTIVDAQASFNRQIFTLVLLGLVFMLVFLLGYLIDGNLMFIVPLFPVALIALFLLFRLVRSRQQLLTLVIKMLKTVN